MNKLDFSKDENIRFLYDKAVEARNFHYDNFTKWQTFFYVAVGSVLIAYCDVMTSDSCCKDSCGSSVHAFLKIFLPALGYMFSLIWLCSSKGYTYWWNAYMARLRRFEGENILEWTYDDSGKPKEKNKNSSYAVYNGPRLNPCEGIFNPFKGANFSTSRLSNALAFVSASSWGCVFAYSVWGQDDTGVCGWIIFILSPIFLTWLMAVPIMRFFFSSDIKDFTEDNGYDARCGCFNGCRLVFSFVVVAVITFLSSLFVCKSETSYSLLLVALVEIWFALSMLLFAALKKICAYFD